MWTLGRQACIYRARRVPGHQGIVRVDNPGTPATASRFRIREIPHRATPCVLQSRRTSCRNIVYHPRSSQRLVGQFLSRQGLCPRDIENRAESIPRNDGQILHHQRPVGVFRHLDDHQTLVG